MVQVEAERDLFRPPQINAGAEIDDADERAVRAIITRIKKGDKRAFGELVDRYRNQVAALAYKMVGDYDEAADITQNVFVKTSQNLWRYDESKRFYTWLYRITVNAAIDYMRKHRRHKHEPLENVQAGATIRKVLSGPLNCANILTPPRKN
jgi:DNA-directed RNA polymerase specialized sigma24 family protein